MSAAGEAVGRALSGWRLTERPPSLREFCGRLLYPGGPLEGQTIDISSDPVHNWVVDQIDSGQYTGLAWCASPQYSGKTLIGIMAQTLHSAIGCGLPTGYALPTLADLDKAWAAKVRPQFVNAGFENALPKSGRGARGGRGPSVQLYREDGKRAGPLIFMAGGAYGDTCARLMVDEADQFRAADGTPDWPAIEDLRARTGSYGPRAFVTFVGTLETNCRERSIILTLAEDQGTGTMPWMPCPSCGRHQRVTGADMQYDARDEMAVAETARIVCQHCTTQIDRDGLYWMQRRMLFVHRGQTVDESGEIQGEAPRTRLLGLVQNCYAATIADLPTIAVKRWSAERLAEMGDNGSLRKHYWYMECTTAPEDGDEDGQTIIPTRNRLAALATRSGYALAVDRRDESGDSVHLAEVPAWVEHVTVGCDVQRGGERAPGRIYFLALGRGDGRSCVLGWGHIIAGPIGRMPTEPELHQALDRLDGLLRDWAPDAAIVQRGVDVGDRKDEIVRWLRSHKTWTPVMGTRPLKAQSLDLPGWIYTRRQDGGWSLVMVETESVTRICHGELVSGDGAGSCAIPAGVDRESTLLRHLCATVEYEPGKWSTRAKDRVHHPEWQYRHDLLDCLAYARALAYAWERRPPGRQRRRYGKIADL